MFISSKNDLDDYFDIDNVNYLCRSCLRAIIATRMKYSEIMVLLIICTRGIQLKYNTAKSRNAIKHLRVTDFSHYSNVHEEV